MPVFTQETCTQETCTQETSTQERGHLAQPYLNAYNGKARQTALWIDRGGLLRWRSGECAGLRRHATPATATKVLQICHECTTNVLLMQGNLKRSHHGHATSVSCQSVTQ